MSFNRYAAGALLATGLIIAPMAAASAAQFTVVQVDTGAKLCANRAASTHKQAWINCMATFGWIIPSANAVLTAGPVCRSTHKVVQLGVQNPRWAYDNRIARPGCS